MNVYHTTAKECASVARDTLALSLYKPEGFSFAAGACAEVELPAGGETRTVSFASAPEDAVLLFAFRHTGSAFKDALASLSEGSMVKLVAPLGSREFTLPEKGATDAPLVFVAGGIGITACRSMLRQARFSGYENDLFLFFANRRREDAAFASEFAHYADAYPRFHFFPVYTRDEGRLSGGFVYRQVLEPVRARYYIAGLPQMAADIKQQLIAEGVPAAHIFLDEFVGY